MFVYAFKLSETLQQKILDQVDYGMSFKVGNGESRGGFILKDALGYIFVRGIEMRT